MLNVFSKKQMYDSVITGKENFIISLLLTRFNIYFVFGYAGFMCLCLKTAIWLFWWKQVGNPDIG